MTLQDSLDVVATTTEAKPGQGDDGQGVEPDDDGQGISELERLRRNNSSLLLALSEERAAREEQDRRIILANVRGTIYLLIIYLCSRSYPYRVNCLR